MNAANVKPSHTCRLLISAGLLACASFCIANAGRAQQGNRYQQAVQQAFAQFRSVQEGKQADYMPALAQADAKLYGVAIVTVSGGIYEGGDSRHLFSIEAAAKPFVLARALNDLGAAAVQKRIGVDQTGQAFDSVTAIEQLAGAQRPPAGNPLVNAGAIATVDMLSARAGAPKWDTIMDTLNAFAGRLLSLDERAYRAEAERNAHDRALTALLADYKVITGDPQEALDLYTKERAVGVSARDLAMMGATLANAGVNPLTNQQVVSPDVARRVLAVMATSGLYENSGDWLFEVGVPAKSGVAGGIVAVVPGRFAIGTFAPPLDAAGNSVRGQRAIAQIVAQLNGNVFGARMPNATAVSRGKTKPGASQAQAKAGGTREEALPR